MITHSKIPLYFIPGAMCDERLWHQVWDHIEAIVPNRFAYKYIPVPAVEELSIAVESIAAKLKSQHNENTEVNLVGFSLGGYLAASLAITEPEYINKLCLVSSMPSALSEAALKIRLRIIALLKQKGYQGLSIKRSQELIDVSKHANMSLIKQIQSMDDKCGGDTLIQQLTLISQRENVLRKLNELLVPVRFMVGANDKKVDLPALINQTQELEDIDVLISPNVGHMFPLEAPNVLAQQIVNWFSTHV